MKRIVAFILCLLLFPCVYVRAEEELSFYEIKIDAGIGVNSEKVIIQDGEIYMLATNFSKYTRYSFDAANSVFYIEGQELNKAFKYIYINAKEKKALFNNAVSFELTDCIELNKKLYLPFCQMLPMLSADIYEIKNDIVYISNNPLSLAEVLYDFDIADYYYNMATEFLDSGWLASAFILPSYLLDTIVDFRIDRLDVVTHSGEYKDYKEIFSEFLTNNDLYLKVIAEDPSSVDLTIDFFKKANDSANDIKSAYDWIEEAGKTNVPTDVGGTLLESLKEYYNSGELETDNIKGLNEAWTSGKISFGDCIEAVSYIYNYISRTEDNCEMLNAVYNVDDNIVSSEADRRAAKQVYDLYGDNVIPAILAEISEKFSEEVLKEFVSPIAIYTATAKAAGVVLEATIPFDFGDISKLSLYSNVVLSSSSKYFSYNTTTDEETKNLRLSLLLCLIASKKCYEIMKDSAEGTGNDTAYYANRIEKIDTLIMGLYVAADNIELDSHQHFGEYKDKNIQKLSALISKLTPIPKTKDLVTYLGKTVAEVKADFGTSFKFESYSGSTLMLYDSGISFFLNTQLLTPSDSAKVRGVVSTNETMLIDDFCGSLTYNDIVSILGVNTAIENPQGAVGMDGNTEYFLNVNYKDYEITYVWTNDPKTTTSVSGQIWSDIPVEYTVEADNSTSSGGQEDQNPLNTQSNNTGSSTSNNSSSVYTGLWEHVNYPDAYSVVVYEQSENLIKLQITAVKGAASRIAICQGSVKLVGGKGSFSFEDSFMNTGKCEITITDNKMDLSYAVNEPYMGWCVDAGAGTYKKTRELSEMPDFEPEKIW